MHAYRLSSRPYLTLQTHGRLSHYLSLLIGSVFYRLGGGLLSCAFYDYMPPRADLLPRRPYRGYEQITCLYLPYLRALLSITSGAGRAEGRAYGHGVGVNIASRAGRGDIPPTHPSRHAAAWAVCAPTKRRWWGAAGICGAQTGAIATYPGTWRCAPAFWAPAPEKRRATCWATRCDSLILSSKPTCYRIGPWFQHVRLCSGTLAASPKPAPLVGRRRTGKMALSCLVLSLSLPGQFSSVYKRHSWHCLPYLRGLHSMLQQCCPPYLGTVANLPASVSAETCVPAFAPHV